MRVSNRVGEFDLLCPYRIKCESVRGGGDPANSRPNAAKFS